MINRCKVLLLLRVRRTSLLPTAKSLKARGDPGRDRGANRLGGEAVLDQENAGPGGEDNHAHGLGVGGTVGLAAGAILPEGGLALGGLKSTTQPH